MATEREIPGRLPKLARRAFAALLLGSATALATPARAVQPDNLASLLPNLLPQGLHPVAVGRRLLADQNGPLTRTDCLARAGIESPVGPLAALRERVSADFGAGRIVMVDRWRLASTEAWLCAALASEA
jgi:hypothetical protein